MAVPPTAIPVGLKQQGNAYSLKQPTEMYPPIHSFVERVVKDAVDYYAIGDYDKAIEILRKERETDANCYAAVVYFEALSMAAQGDYRDATALLNESVSTEPPRGFASCRIRVIIAGLVGSPLQDNSLRLR
jgi:tetratricopeptide (TPR) repeat protein